MMKKIILTYILIGIVSLLYSQNLQWIVNGRMPIAVSGHRAVALDSVILIIGGFSDSLNSPVDIIQEYNPRSNSWRILNTRLKHKRDFFVINQFADSLIIFGGVKKAPTPRDYFSMEVFRPSTISTIPRFNPIFNRSYTESLRIGKNILLFGGKKIFVHGDTTRCHFMTVYNLEKDSVEFITNISSLSDVPFQLAIEDLDYFVYTFGGVSFGVLNHIYRVNLLNYQVTRVPINLLQPRAGSCAVKIDPQTILIIGGYNEYFRALRTTEKFKVSGSSISIEFGPTLNIPRKNFSAVVFNNTVYVFGGEDQTGRNTPTIEKLTLPTSVENHELLPEKIFLYQNYPNPFNPNTYISFELSQKSKVSLVIYDVLGKKIKNLVNEELEQGTYTFEWNGQNEMGENVPSGIYLYRLNAGNSFLTKKMILIR